MPERGPLQTNYDFGGELHGDLGWLGFRQKDLSANFTESIKNACMAYSDLSVKERGLLCRGYWKVLEKLREQREHFSELEQQVSNPEHLNLIAAYGKKVEDELAAACNGFVELIDSFLLPVAGDTQAIVFYRRMKAEQYLYMVEAKTGDERERLAENSKTEYEEAFQTARTELTSANRERLGLEFRRSLFYCTILDEVDSAVDFARKAARETIHELNDPSEQEPVFTPLADLTISGDGGNSGFSNAQAEKRK